MATLRLFRLPDPFLILPREEHLEDYAHDLQAALERMSFELEPGRFTLLGFDALPSAEDLAFIGDGPGQLVREHGETTLLLPAVSAEEALRAHPDAKVERGFVWVRFVAAMDWEVVGFLAKVTGSLAAAGVPLGAVCGFSRDHLFIHEAHLEPTLATLNALFAGRGDYTPEH
jgi:uncharacterized protein